MHDYKDAAYEEAVARAHRSVFWASQRAADVGRVGDQLDLEQILKELTRIGSDALKRKPRRTVRH